MITLRSETPGSAVIYVEGEVDEAQAGVLIELCRRARERYARFVLDLRNVTHIEGAAAWAIEAALSASRGLA